MFSARISNTINKNLSLPNLQSKLIMSDPYEFNGKMAIILAIFLSADSKKNDLLFFRDAFKRLSGCKHCDYEHDHEYDHEHDYDHVHNGDHHNHKHDGDTPNGNAGDASDADDAGGVDRKTLAYIINESPNEDLKRFLLGKYWNRKIGINKYKN